MDQWTKKEYELSWDNSGRQISFDQKTDTVILSLDIDDQVIEFAKKNKSKLILTHHPMFFVGLKQILQGTYQGDNIIRLIQEEISVYSAHTTLDIAKMGVNDALADLLDLKHKIPLSYEEELPMGIVGDLKDGVDVKNFIAHLKEELDIPVVHLYGQGKEEIQRIGLCGGAGGEFMKDAVKKDVDLFITGDIKYHDGQYAYENHLLVLDLGHYHSEKIILQKIESYLKQKFPLLKVEIYPKSNYEIPLL